MERDSEKNQATELTAADFVKVADRLIDVQKSGLPLVSGLRALSQETPSLRLRRILEQISRQLEDGQSLTDALNQNQRNLPSHLGALIQAGFESGQLGYLLDQYLMHTRRDVDIRRRLQFSLAYPLVLLVCTVGVLYFGGVWIVPQFREIFEDFGVQLPILTETLLWLADLMASFGIWILNGAILLILGSWIAFGWIGGRPLRRRICGMIPVLGPLLNYPSLAQFCHLLALMIESRVRLPEALRMTGPAIGDANIQEGCELLAQEIEAGINLGDAASVLPNFPPHLVQIFYWESRHEAFPDALRAAGEVYHNAARMQGGLVGLICQPLFLAVLAVVIGGGVIALFMPLVKLLNDLS